MAQYQYRVVHIPGSTNPATFLTRKRFPEGQGPAPHSTAHTGSDEPDSALELFTASGRRSRCRVASVSARRLRGRGSRGAPV